MNTCRLIQSGFSDAATNMAVDEALFLCYCEGASSPILRLYGWTPASFSIGISQNPEHLSLNTAFVRRPTGGGALFHDNELTYSFVASCRDLGLSSGVKESYAAVTSFLIKVYESLGFKARFAKDAGPADNIDPHTVAHFCQARKEEYDLVINGQKIGGNAQKRRKNIFLQHGSIPLIIGFDDLSEIVLKAFAQHFGVRLVPGELTPEERACAEKLKIDKYNNVLWNVHGKTINAKAGVA